MVQLSQIMLDFDLDFLRAAAALVDGSLERLDNEAKPSPDPDAFGILDQVEYITGFGFVACQAYAAAVVGRRRSKLKKWEALALGPKHRTGRSMVELINAAANHWKHSPEWTLDALSPRAENIVAVISTLGVNASGSYPLANMLHKILTPDPARFANLIPFLTQWRDGLPR